MFDIEPNLAIQSIKIYNEGKLIYEQPFDPYFKLKLAEDKLYEVELEF